MHRSHPTLRSYSCPSPAPLALTPASSIDGAPTVCPAPWQVPGYKDKGSKGQGWALESSPLSQWQAQAWSKHLAAFSLGRTTIGDREERRS